MAFKRVKPLPVPGSPSLVKAQKKGLVLGAKERRVYALAEPGVPLSSIIALSRIGEFETLSSASHLYECPDARTFSGAPMAALDRSTALSLP